LAEESEVQQVQNNRQIKAPLHEVTDTLQELLQDKNLISKSELVQQLMAKFEASERIIGERLKSVKEQELQLFDTHGKVCRLVDKKQDRKLYYQLEPLAN
jgi:hypothetical protein